MTRPSQCPACGLPIRTTGTDCPACASLARRNRTGMSTQSAARLLGLGLALTTAACAKSIYGVPMTDDFDDLDGDGWTAVDGDCDDDDPDIHPEAEETEGDGIDSNCDGDDDT